MTIKGKFFYGNEVSEYGQKCGYVDYRTLAKAFDAVMCNDIMTATSGTDCGEWEQLTDGRDYDRIEELDEKIDAINDELFDLYHEEETSKVLAEIEEKEAELKELEETILTASEKFAELEMKLYEDYSDQMLYSRNKVMTEAVEKLLSEKKNVFYVVGAAHFLGEKGIVSLLEKDGYTVERVEY